MSAEALEVQDLAFGEDPLADPVWYYAQYLREKHAKVVSDYFEDILRKSGVDEAENRAQVAFLEKMAEQIKKVKLQSYVLKFCCWTVFLALIGDMALIVQDCELSVPYLLWGCFLAGVPFLVWLWHLVDERKERLARFKKIVSQKQKEAWAAVTRLHRLFDWEMALHLVEKTFPALSFDDFFKQSRMREIQEQFGWDGDLGENCSVLQAYSGAFNGNPFILGRRLNHWMGNKTYTGSLTIHWTTQERNAEGKYETRHHSQTLTASVTVPFPEYREESFLLYANEAAPDLIFSRTPSKLSGLGEGMFSKFRKNHTIRRLEKQSLKSDHNFTLLANREFEALFGAENRNHEVQFRLLFTAMAQQQMLKLLKEKENGAGDCFSFFKEKKMNMIRTPFLDQMALAGNPHLFEHYNIAEMRAFFNRYHQDFMYALYFAFAPLFTIPLYRHHRSHQEMYKDIYAARPCFWEHEAVANTLGEKFFAHAQSVTRNILKTRVKQEESSEAELEKVAVKASGFRSVARISYIPKWGGDGRRHNVPVPWVEFLPVSQDGEMLVGTLESGTGNIPENLKVKTPLQKVRKHLMARSLP